MLKKWVLNNQNFSFANQLKETLNVPLIFAQLLEQRGVTSYSEAKQFLRPSSNDFHSPFLMLNMSEAVDRILLAKNKNQRVMVYGDYDVDGTCSVALMFLFIQNLGINVIHYQPDRYKEGYGISMIGVEKAKKEKIDLVIALDCGVKAIEQSKELKKADIDLIICDHHLPGKNLPVCVAMLNPKQPNCAYPFKELCGCAIGFKLIQAIGLKLELNQEYILSFLDLAAIATAADIVPMVGENRVIVKLGLELMNASPRHGVKALLETSNKKGKLESSDLVFSFSPRINAAGRLAHASIAVELLASKAKNDALNFAKEIEQINSLRKQKDKTITQEALLLLENDKYKVTSVVCSDNWHKGVVGIVASRLIETYYRPTVVLCDDGEFITGSVRSVKGFDVHEILVEIEDVFERYGGHKYAAGVTLYRERLIEFKKRFEEAVKRKITKEVLSQKIQIDAEVSPLDLIRDKMDNPFPKLYRLVSQMAPFGPGNMRPVFKLENMVDAGNTRVVGETHLKLNVKQLGGNLTFDGIGFGLGHLEPIVKKQGTSFAIAFSLEKNQYNGHTSFQLRVRDLVS
ncbi:MAG: single-stranded-DNA-specific exonuclease RecJ [Crocinitomicaceae bacterium]|nr:single-stranded-DNA-specific exonuclease RecJ [Crocinitomicaceae bacterium]